MALLIAVVCLDCHCHVLVFQDKRLDLMSTHYWQYNLLAVKIQHNNIFRLMKLTTNMLFLAGVNEHIFKHRIMLIFSTVQLNFLKKSNWWFLIFSVLSRFVSQVKFVDIPFNLFGNIYERKQTWMFFSASFFQSSINQQNKNTVNMFLLLISNLRGTMNWNQKNMFWVF